MARTNRASSAKPSVCSEAERATVTIVGIGNEFRGDDAVGLMVLRQLEMKPQAGARTIELTGDQTYLLELMRSTDAMIIVDAVQSSAPAGTIFRLDASCEPVPKGFLSFSTHAIDSAAAVEMARTLGALPQKILIYGIVGKEFSYTNLITPEVEEAIDVIRERIIDDVDSLLGKKRLP